MPSLQSNRFRPPKHLPPTLNVMIGVAGHIDHGKTELVKMLTGCDTDRLKEEKERGMSIDIGYAPCFVGNSRVGIVDVPGHERFIRNMVAGATGIDIALLVIAADDGVMPQTREHLDIIELLGIRHAVVAITKTDLVSAERIEEVRLEILEFLERTSFQNVPILPVSSMTGDGIESLRWQLQNTIDAVGPRKTKGVFRVPVGRVFSSHGHGVVATGVSVSGLVKSGDTVEILPAQRTVRVRGVQVYLGDAEEGIAGQCVALNLANVDQEDLKRGSVIASPGFFSCHSSFTVRLKASLFLEKPIRNAARIRFHTGTSETLGKIRLLEGDELRAGKEIFAQLFLDQPVTAFLRDRFILRMETPPSTAAGGIIVECDTRRRKRQHEPTLTQLWKRLRSFDSDNDFLSVLMEDQPYTLQTIENLSKMTSFRKEEILKILDQFLDQKKVIQIGEKYLLTGSLHSAKEKLLAALNRLHQQFSERYTFSEKEIQKEMQTGDEIIDLALSYLVREKRIISSTEGYRSSEAISIDPHTEALANHLEKILLYEKFQTSSPDQLAQKVHKPQRVVNAALRFLTEKERIRRLDEKVYLHDQHVQWAKTKLVAAIKQNGFFETHKFKNIIGSSRKYAIPLLDYFDSIGLTRRIGGNRYLCEKKQ